ncbi:putative oligomerization/nucleic acid binding protein [Arcticibacter pallidicorallinus]|uniref:Putative oligomerization/nucleic acid binding protein n=1 Tax=Arcticibacter pallidicorallinus TaxID=1259464 RepID=A0A2T0TT93_9SPHI|nr:PH domain-containing protein [Arcticibacter pallidicorallinus]PRY48885.1 putative oligomerization/nucleic acid binding protein [Arcticibacter pallidicorallinus]
MNFEKFLIDEQDPKAVEKILIKLQDMLTPGEEVLYLAVQKKPAVTLVPDTIAVTSKRLFFCIPGNLGLTTNFEIYSWKDIKEVSFKEEFFGARFTAVPLSGENFTVDYIPKVQARKLYQFSNQQIDRLKAELKQEQYLKEQQQRREQFEKESIAQEVIQPVVAETVAPAPEPVEAFEDEITMKLKKLKVLFEKQLISQEEYEAKKSDILSQF